MSHALRPSTLAEACEAKAQGALPYAGGTDVMVRQRDMRRAGLGAPLLFLDAIPEMQGIHPEADGIRIGAMNTMAEIAAHQGLPPLLRLGCGSVGSPALRNVATIGGNICSASPAADSVAPLHALDALAEVSGPTGARRLSLQELLLGPARTTLGEDELLTAVILPERPLGRHFHRKVAPRLSNAITKVSLAAWALVEGGVDDGMVSSVRLAFGAVGPVVIRCREAEAMINAAAVNALPEQLSTLRQIVMDTISPIDDQRSTADYRRLVAANLMELFVLELCHGDGHSQETQS